MASVILRRRSCSSTSFWRRRLNRATGRAVAARMAMIATTVTISAIVKPFSALCALRSALCIWLLHARPSARDRGDDRLTAAVAEVGVVDHEEGLAVQSSVHADGEHDSAADELQRLVIRRLHFDRSGLAVDDDGRHGRRIDEEGRTEA